MLKLNDDKTVMLHIRSPYSRPMPPVVRGLQIGTTAIFPSTSARNIGVLFDDELKMTTHIDSVCRSCFSQLRNLSKIRHLIPSAYMKMLVHAFITSRLDYANALLIGLPDGHLQRLQRIQNVAARLVTGCDRSTSSTELLRSLHWLPVRARIKFKINIMTYRCLNNMAPSYLKELIKPYVPSRSLRSGNKNLLVVPRSRSIRYGRRAFAFAAPTEWNALPETVRLSDSLFTFKSRLKTHLFPKDD